MTRWVLGIATPLAFVLGVGLASAQAPPIQTTPPQTIGPNQARPPNPRGFRLSKPKNSRGVTATGCLRLEREVAARPEIAASGDKPGDGYVLLGAKLSGSGVTTGGQEATAELYRLAGLSNEKFRAYDNQQVQVKGRLNLGRITSDGTDGDKTSNDGDGKGGGSGSSSGAVGDEKKGLPTITATSIKSIASSCAAGSN